MQIKILIIATLLACINTQENGLIEAIKTEAKNVAASYPSNYESLIKNLQGATSMVTDSIKYQSYVYVHQIPLHISHQHHIRYYHRFHQR